MEETATAFGKRSRGRHPALLPARRAPYQEGRFDAALEAYERVLALDCLNQKAKKGLIAVGDGRKRERLARQVPLDKVPVLLLGAVTLTQQKFDSQEGFVLSRINGQWDVRSILKLCPMPEEDVAHHLRPPARAEGHRVPIGRA